MQNKKIIFGILLAFLIPAVTFGADYLPKDKENGENVVVDGTYRNLYVGGTNVTVNSNVAGDLFAGGSNINIAAPIEEDLFIVGSNVTISSPVNGDARILGGTVVINAPITGDLLVAGGTVSLGEQASIGGDVWVAGGEITLTSAISGQLKVAGEKVYINNTVSGDTFLSTTRSLRFGPQAIVLGAIQYMGDKDPIIETGAQIGTIDRQPLNKNKMYKDGFDTGPAVLKTFILIITLFVLWKFLRAQTQRLIQNTTKGFGMNLLYGFIALLLLPMLAILSMFTILGFALGMMLLFGYIVCIILAMAISLGVLGTYTEKLLKLDGNGFSYRTIFWGAIANFAISMIPIFGFALNCIFFIASFGAILKTLKAKMNS